MGQPRLKKEYEQIIKGQSIRNINRYGIVEIVGTPHRDKHVFYINNVDVISVRDHGHEYVVNINFVETDYNLFRSLLRNLGVKTTGRKHITVVEFPNGEKRRRDHLAGQPWYSHPPILFPGYSA